MKEGGDAGTLIIPGKEVAVFDLHNLLPHEGPALRFLERTFFYDYRTGEAMGRKIMMPSFFDFMGHIPGNPVYPGHCIQEGFNLASGGLGIILHPFLGGGTFVRSIKMKFEKPVRVWDIITYSVFLKNEKITDTGRIAVFSGKARDQKGITVAEGEITGVSAI